jgi:hypothetical protein
MRSNNPRLRIVAGVLLGLMLHAWFVVTTHHHPIQIHLASSATPTVSQDRHTPEQHLPQSSDDFHCATCNLQRGLTSQHTAPVFALQLVGQSVRWETIHIEPQSVGAFPSSISRAPPVA